MRTGFLFVLGFVAVVIALLLPTDIAIAFAEAFSFAALIQANENTKHLTTRRKALSDYIRNNAESEVREALKKLSPDELAHLNKRLDNLKND
jgi:hypothetical protein